MGCVSSSEPDTTAAASATLRTSPAAGGTALRSELSTSRTTAKPAAKQKSYETELAASLVDGGAKTVAYHGLLSDAGKLSLVRAGDEGTGKVFVKSQHPKDDANDGVTDGDEATVVTGVAMTMPYVVITAKPASHDQVSSIALEIFATCDAVFNGWNPDSEVSKLNKLPPGKKTAASGQLLKLFEVVDQVYALTDGRFDPTTGVLSVAFENSIREKARPPLPSEINNFKFAVGWHRRMERKGDRVGRGNGNIVLDFDGIAKGFVIDQIVEALVAAGFEDCYVDWAGDVRASGKHPSGRLWRSAVVLPPDLKRVFKHWQNSTLPTMLSEDDIGFLAHFAFREDTVGGAIATSGDYFSILKYGYHHIASPHGMTVLKANQSTVGSVCVAATTCAVADAVATAAMTFGHIRESIAFLQALSVSNPDVIQGFCVMGRTEIPKELGDAFSPIIFAPHKRVAESISTVPTQVAGATEGVSGEDMKAVYDSIINSSATICFRGASVEVNSWTSCSVDPDPVVTFLAPKKFTKGASTVEEDENNNFCAFLLGSSSDQSNQKSKVKVDLSFTQITAFGDCDLVAAAIKNVSLNACNTVEVIRKDSIIFSTPLDLGISRTMYAVAELHDKAKTLFRQTPSTVWTVVARSADQEEFGLTATSVVVPEILGNCLVFNVTHSSAFYAGFGGVSSAVRFYALSAKQQAIAKKFVSSSRVTVEDMSQLMSESLVAVEGIIESVTTVQDHDVLLARVIRTLNIGESSDPLVWLNGSYIDC